VPRSVKALPAEVLSHSGDYGPLGALQGQRVAVLGSGASASDLAALLHERGVAVSLVTSAPALRFACPPRLPTLWERLVEPAGGIGSGWVLKTCADAPWLTRLLPKAQRLRLATVPGPLGGAFMKDRVVGKAALFLAHTVKSAEARGGAVRLFSETSDGARTILHVDHVIAATGYRIDIDRLAFLPADLRARLRRFGGAPDLSLKYESSVPGLYFIGPAAANSLGPVARFVFGGMHASRSLARELPRRLGRRLVRVSAASGAVSPVLRRVGSQ
jgi:pyruvate/2-oxoglutarate dehydrogenase complex dihydrolipoamide dehydrogenase (E3) component